MARITDKMRLNWIEYMGASATILFGAHAHPRWAILTGSVQFHTGVSARAAIDAAIRQERKK